MNTHTHIIVRRSILYYKREGSMKTFCGAPTQFDIMTEREREMIKGTNTSEANFQSKASILLCFHPSFSRAPLFLPSQYRVRPTLGFIGSKSSASPFRIVAFSVRAKQWPTRERDGPGIEALCAAGVCKQKSPSDANRAPSRAHH